MSKELHRCVYVYILSVISSLHKIAVPSLSCIMLIHTYLYTHNACGCGYVRRYIEDIYMCTYVP